MDAMSTAGGAQVDLTSTRGVAQIFLPRPEPDVAAPLGPTPSPVAVGEEAEGERVVEVVGVARPSTAASAPVAGPARHSSHGPIRRL